MTEMDLIKLAEEAGFLAAVLSAKEIPVDASFRKFCEDNLCGKYNANYSCPPDCGSPEEMKQKILQYQKAVVLQTVWNISDYSDIPAIKHAKGEHNAAELRLVRCMREDGHGGIIVGASGCALCSPCAIQNGEPCRFPELQYSCMSAYCIFVRKLAESCGMDYDCGEGELALFGMYAFE